MKKKISMVNLNTSQDNLRLCIRTRTLANIEGSHVIRGDLLSNA